jgi:hypothetical protein
MIPSVHMVMGVEEANVIGVALNLLNAKIEFDLERFEDKSADDQDEFMAMLSVKFTTENMLSSIQDLLTNGEIEMGGDDHECD